MSVVVAEHFGDENMGAVSDCTTETNKLIMIVGLGLFAIYFAKSLLEKKA